MWPFSDGSLALPVRSTGLEGIGSARGRDASDRAEEPRVGGLWRLLGVVGEAQNHLNDRLQDKSTGTFSP